MKNEKFEKRVFKASQFIGLSRSYRHKRYRNEMEKLQKKNIHGFKGSLSIGVHYVYSRFDGVNYK